jgi:hypothetical protein
MSYDPDALTRAERRKADLEFAKRAIAFYRHQALVAQLASERAKHVARGAGAHGPAVPQHSQEGIDGIKPFDINDI